MTQVTSTRRKALSDVNRVYAEDQPVHRWYRFVLSFPPHLVRDYLERFGLTADDRVLDPFCGTGTTLVECKKLGIPSVGIEAHPMGHFASVVKTDWSPDAAGLSEHARRVAGAAFAQLDADGVGDVAIFSNSVDHLRRLPEPAERLLLRGSISPVPLHRTLVLLDYLEQLHDRRYAGHERLALATALVTSISNLHFGPEVGVGRAKPDASAITPWLAQIDRMAQDLASANATASGRAEVLRGDARRDVKLLAPGSVSAVITSPPYPNEKDYTRITRLESVVLGLIQSKEELRQLKRQLIRSNTRGVYKGDGDDAWVAELPTVQRLADAIERRRLELGKTSGFERLYATVTKLYFGGMARHLADLRECLRPGARLAYVVGDQASYLRVMIRTGQVLAEIAESLGYEVLGMDLFRTRLATATKEQLREEVLVLRWPAAGPRTSSASES